MKILLVTSFFSPVHGGSAEVPYQLSKHMARKGHEVTIYTSDYKLSPEYINSAPEVNIYPFKTWLSWVKFHVTPGMVKSIKENIAHFDVIHMHNYYTFQNIVVHYYARKNRIPYVLQAHGSVATFFQRGMLKRVFSWLWGNRILKDAAKLIAVTAIEAGQYQSMGASSDKIEVVPHGIDSAEFEDLPPRGEFRREYGFDENHKLILYLGRIDKIKGLALLAKAFSGLLKELSNARLVIVGPDDGYLPELKRLIKRLMMEEKVLFTGPLYGKDKLEAYVDADIYVLPSFYEIFGITVLEAIACGTPVIVTDRCGIAEWINGKAGLVVPHDKDQLQAAFLHMLNDDKMSLKFSEKGKILVREELNWEKIAERVEGVYQAASTQRH